MENKVYEIQGQTFKLLSNDLKRLNKAVPLVKRLRKLIYKDTGDIDLSVDKQYKDRINELSEANEQVEEVLKTGKLSDGTQITDTERAEYEARIPKLTESLDKVIEEYKGNTELQSLLTHKSELEYLCMLEILSDTDYLIKGLETDVDGKQKKTWQGLSAILSEGDLSKIDLSDIAVVKFLKEVVEDFFAVISKNNLT